jgi:hypothetical protein
MEIAGEFRFAGAQQQVWEPRFVAVAGRMALTAIDDAATLVARQAGRPGEEARR